MPLNTNIDENNRHLLSSYSPGTAFVADSLGSILVLLLESEEVEKELGIVGECLVLNTETGKIFLMDRANKIKSVGSASVTIS